MTSFDAKDLRITRLSLLSTFTTCLTDTMFKKLTEEDKKWLKETVDEFVLFTYSDYPKPPRQPTEAEKQLDMFLVPDTKQTVMQRQKPTPPAELMISTTPQPITDEIPF